jgi:hypothetical protein
MFDRTRSEDQLFLCRFAAGFYSAFGGSYFATDVAGFCHFLCVQKVAQKDALAAGLRP